MIHSKDIALAQRLADAAGEAIRRIANEESVSKLFD